MHLTLERIDAMNDDKLKITLRIADLKTPLALRVDYGADEKYWRDAADLFNKRWAFYKDKYKDGLMDSESMMAMVAVEMARLYWKMKDVMHWNWIVFWIVWALRKTKPDSTESRRWNFRNM